MVAKTYVPDRGDVVWVDVNSTRGREQAKIRPAVVISPKNYNQKTSLAILCPITSVQKDYPFEVVIRAEDINGVVLTDHIRSLDWRARNVTFVAKAKPKVMKEVLKKLSLLFGLH